MRYTACFDLRIVQLAVVVIRHHLRRCIEFDRFDVSRKDAESRQDMAHVPVGIAAAPVTGFELQQKRVRVITRAQNPNQGAYRGAGDELQ